MATQTMTRIGTFTWSHSSQFLAEDVDAEPFTQDCFTCPRPVTERDGHWYCDQNGEVVHLTCRIPNFDYE